MITIVIILSRVDIPAAYFVAVHTVIRLISNKGRPVILGQKAAVCFLPRLVLYIRRRQIFGQGREYAIFYISTTIRKRCVVQPPKGSKLSEGWQSSVDKILVCTGKVIAYDPVEITL